MQSRNSVLSFVLIALAGSGCGLSDTPERVPSRRPVRTEAVDYRRINPGATSIPVPAVANEFPKTPQRLPTPRTMKPRELVVFKGSVNVPKVDGGAIRVAFTAPDKRGHQELYQVHVEPAKLQDDGETVAFATQMRAPEQLGSYDVCVYFLFPEMQEDGQPGFANHLIAQGRSEVRERPTGR